MMNSEARLEDQQAAERIQRTYRGYRTRRQLHGFGLDAQTRWYETVKDAQYQKLTTPVPSQPKTSEVEQLSSEAKSKWGHATRIAQRAGADDVSVSESSSTVDEVDQHSHHGVQHNKTEPVVRQNKTAKMMDLQYFLEMVDQKHRYGSNLRKYHAHWRQQDTHENFFYWLDYGEGKDVQLPECSRERLDRMQVRYLSKAERQNYLVRVNEQGLLVWAKNDELVWTKDELYKDSINGIVPIKDSTPKFDYNIKPTDPSSSEDDDGNGTAGDETDQDVVKETHRPKGPAKIKHVSAAVAFNHMVHKSLTKGRKWIFVADTSFRLYIGYKQSGAFQHSSFLHGSRIAAAGTIKVKHGQLRSLAPLSGHYRPPTENFRAFVHSMKDAGVDMSRVSISKSYAVLLGMEGYTKGHRQLKAVEKSITEEFDKTLRPRKAELDAEQQQDKSQSAQKEQAHLEKQNLQQKQSRRQGSISRRIGTKIARLFKRNQ